MTMLLVTMAVGLGGPPTTVKADYIPPVSHTLCVERRLLATYSGLWHAVRRQYRHSDKDAMGRNIRRQGLRNGWRSRCRDLARSVRTLRGLHMPPAARRVTYTGPPAVPPSGAATLYAGGALERIAACESGGDPTAVNPNGHYGKFQFDIPTWNSVGGSGNPAAASEAEQNKRAAILYSQRGSAPWECKP